MCSSRNAWRTTLLVLAVSLTGCAPLLPPVQAAPPKIPPPAPELMEAPDLSVSYSEAVRKLLSDWQRLLTDWKRKS